MEEHTHNLYTVAFYNLENLFDTTNNPDTLDDDFTPKGRKRWNNKRYHRKIKKLSRAIAQIGVDKTKKLPSLIGIAEVENYEVVNDLIVSKYLKEHSYGIVHYDSEDERGIEVGLLYKKEDFELLDSKNYTLLLINELGERDYTRDILYVKGKLKGELVYILVNHWPSRRSGTQETEHKRIAAAKKNHEIIATILNETPDAKIIMMGDFNDNPNSPSIKHHLVSEAFYNPFESFFDKGFGTSTHDREWYLFDQIIFSKNFFTQDASLTFKHAEIFNEHFLKSWKGKYKGKPFRTYIGKWYQGGFSDHYPVFLTLEGK